MPKVSRKSSKSATENKLVIVESPTKAKTIAKFLGSGYSVESSFGHIRDLPKSKIGVDVENGFTPSYLIPREKKARVKELQKLAASASEVYFATDADREGEAISWHLAAVLDKDPKHIKRITFHEITKKAITDALTHPRDLDLKLVDAQQARRILDRLVGYELSPFLWRKVRRGLSAGRVQSVAVRLIVEREQEIEKFVPQEYWSIDLLAAADGVKFSATLHSQAGERVEKMSITTEKEAQNIVTALQGAKFVVKNIEQKKAHRSPPAPFTTSTLQQEANRRLGASAKLTMMLAQRLYEGVVVGGQGSTGLITYMRTDSVSLAPEFQADTVGFIKTKFGDTYTTGPRFYTTKSKLAQEAHEAIRPTDIRLTPEVLASSGVDAKLVKMYDLIWRRALASQMTDAEFNQAAIDLSATGTDKKEYVFRATGQTILFPGFLAVYPDSAKETNLPKLAVGAAANADSITPTQHFTEPPARYSDATLVKVLEEYGIGRPSTYAPTIATVIDRGYVERDEKRRLKPTAIALVVTKLLVEHFPMIVDYEFTAHMEDDFDEIAQGEKKMGPVLADFYGPFKANLTEKFETVENMKTPDEPTDEICDKCGKPLVIKEGRFGKFKACTGYPECKNTKPILVLIGMKCPTCHEGDLIEKHTRYGKLFFSCSRYPECKGAFWDKPNGELCEVCKAPMVQPLKGKAKCSNKECSTNPRSSGRGRRVKK